MLNAEKRRELRAAAQGTEISHSNYIGALLGVVLYGLIVNAITCSIVPYEWVFENYTPIVIGYFISCFIGIFISSKSSNPIVSFIGYNFVVVPVGIIVAGVVGAYAAVDPTIVRDAFMITTIITFVMAVLGYVKPQWFEKIGTMLFAILLGILIAEIVLLILGVSQYITTWIGAVLFTFYIGYDVHRAMQYPHTLDNAVDCALDLYLDIINLFLKIMKLLARSKSNSRSRS